MTKKALWMLVGLVLISSMACQFVEDMFNPTSAPPPIQVATATLAPVAPATVAPSAVPATAVSTIVPPGGKSTPLSGGDTFAVTVDNQTPYDICYVYISPSDSDSWGDDWLGEENTIDAGTSKTLAVPNGTYDMLVADCDHTTLGTAWNLDADTTVSFGGAGKAALRMMNDSDAEICFVYITPSAGELGDDWLGDLESIASGHDRIFFVDPGIYTIITEDCDHNKVYSEDGVQVSGETTWIIPGTAAPQVTPQAQGSGAQGSGEPFQVILHNKTPDDICYVYISPSDSDTWGDDWLGDSQLASGDSRTFDVPAGTYDMKAENCDEVILATAWDISSTLELSPGENGNTPVTVINHTGTKVCYLYISPVTSDSWGADLLGSLEIIPTDGGRRLFYIQPGKYDLLAQDCDDNDIAELDNVDIQSAYTWDITE